MFKNQNQNQKQNHKKMFCEIKGASIDKLVLSTDKEINLDKFYKDEKSGLCSISEINTPYYRQGFYLKYIWPSETTVTILFGGQSGKNHIRLNPSEIGGVSCLNKFLLKTGVNKWSYVKEIHFNIDLESTLNEVLKKFDLKHKQTTHKYSTSKGRLTGLDLGSIKTHQISVYDKAAQLRVNERIIRVESRFTRKHEAIKHKSIKEVFKLPAFKGAVIRLYSFAKAINEKDERRIYALKLMIKTFGFYLTLKTLNQNKNFPRNFGKLMVFYGYIDLQDIFDEELGDYLKELCNVFPKQ